MEDIKKPDFKRHTSPPVSKKYLFRIAFYMILLTILIIVLYNVKNKTNKPGELPEVIEFKNLGIETE